MLSNGIWNLQLIRIYGSCKWMYTTLSTLNLVDRQVRDHIFQILIILLKWVIIKEIQSGIFKLITYINSFSNFIITNYINIDISFLQLSDKINT